MPQTIEKMYPQPELVFYPQKGTAAPYVIMKSVIMKSVGTPLKAQDVSENDHLVHRVDLYPSPQRTRLEGVGIRYVGYRLLIPDAAKDENGKLVPVDKEDKQFVRLYQVCVIEQALGHVLAIRYEGLMSSNVKSLYHQKQDVFDALKLDLNYWKDKHKRDLSALHKKVWFDAYLQCNKELPEGWFLTIQQTPYLQISLHQRWILVLSDGEQRKQFSCRGELIDGLGRFFSVNSEDQRKCDKEVLPSLIAVINREVIEFGYLPSWTEGRLKPKGTLKRVESLADLLPQEVQP